MVEHYIWTTSIPSSPSQAPWTQILFKFKYIIISILLAQYYLPVSGVPLLKAWPTLTQKLQPLSKLGASKGSYLQDSFRTTQLIPSLQRIKTFVINIHTDIVHIRSVVISGFLVTALVILVLSVSFFFNLSKVNKVSVLMEKK